jgi:signal transduction histidine kinase
VFEHGETRTYDRVDTETNVLNPDTMVKSEIIAPLGKYGILNIGSMEPGVFDEGDVSLANLLAANTEAALERAEREHLLREREHELERQNERLEEFASVVSHDLRNPLGVARGRLELAHEESPTEHYEDIQWALSRMDSLIEDLLALARQGAVVDETTMISLESVARAAWAGIESESANITFADELGDIEADADRLQRLLENLFRNAIEHGNHEISVCVGRFSAGFFVADDGPGIPESEHERVFESGYSTGEGTGLGLAIVRTIAEAHGWTVSIARSDAGGARFEVRT